MLRLCRLSVRKYEDLSDPNSVLKSLINMDTGAIAERFKAGTEKREADKRFLVKKDKKFIKYSSVRKDDEKYGDTRVQMHLQKTPKNRHQRVQVKSMEVNRVNKKGEIVTTKEDKKSLQSVMLEASSGKTWKERNHIRNFQKLVIA